MEYFPNFNMSKKPKHKKKQKRYKYIIYITYQTIFIKL